MKYKALRDSFDHNRKPGFCVAGRVYEFDKDPGKHFECIEKSPLSEKDLLLREAEELGLELDKRKSVENLRRELDAAKQEVELRSYGEQ